MSTPPEALDNLQNLPFSLVQGEPEPKQEPATPEPEVKAAPEPKQPEVREQEPEAPKDDAAVKAERLQHALHESRQQAREAKEAAEKLRQEMDARELRMAEYVKQTIAKQNQPAQPEKDPRPDRAEDPIGYVEWENRKLRERLEKIEQNNQQTQQIQAQNDQISDIQRHIYADEQRFVSQTPDYLDAVNHVQNQYAAVLEMQGYKPGDIANQLQLWGTQFGAAQIQQGKSPAEQFYALASRLGYKKAEATAPETGDKVPSQLDMIEKGQKQAGLGSGGGDIQKDDTSPEDEFPLLTQTMREVGFI